MNIKNTHLNLEKATAMLKGGCTLIGGTWKDVTTDELLSKK